MLYPPMHTPTLPHCPESMRPHVDRVLAGEYEPPEHVDVSGVRTVLDIGANVGAFTAWALKRFPGCTVSAYEPHPQNAQQFWQNFKDNKADSWLLYESAVWCNDGSLDLYDGPNNCGEASIMTPGPVAHTVRSVEGRKVGKHDFVKIDAEGAELVILQNLDLSETDVVALEWHGETRRNECNALLEKQGFECVRATPYGKDTGIRIYARPHIIKSPAKKEPKVFVALPVYGHYHAHFVHSLMHLIQEPPCKLQIKPNCGDSLVSRSRNVLAAEFLKSDCTHLLFIDTDLIFSPEHVARLVSHDKDIVAGLYPKKQRKLAWVCNMIAGEEPDENGLQRIAYAGTGFLMISRRVFERMIEAYPQIAYRPDAGEEGDKWDLFPVGVHNGRYLSEDWFFCQRALELGFDVWADTRVVLKHVGEMIYPLDNPFDSPATA